MNLFWHRIVRSLDRARLGVRMDGKLYAIKQALLMAAVRDVDAALYAEG
ncbi:hypothetical protein [Janthinobacterium sp. HLX7-2]